MTEQFKNGDIVLVAGQVAHIVNINYNADRLVFETVAHGGAINTQYGHVSNTQIEAAPAGTPFPGVAVLDAVKEEPVVVEKPTKKASDE